MEKVELYKKEAIENGLIYIQYSHSGYHRYQFKDCGHYKNIKPNKVRRGEFACKICKQDKILKEAQDNNLEILDTKREKGRTLYLYKFKDCGHTSWLDRHNVKKGQFHCKTCHEDKLSQEANDCGLKMISDKSKGSKRYYQFDCGCKQWISLSLVRTKQVVCNSCIKTYMDKPSVLYLLQITVEDKEFLKIGFSNNLKTRIRDYGLPKSAKVEILETVDFDSGRDSVREETRLHRKHSKYRIERKEMLQYFKSGFTECFTTDCREDLLEQMKKDRSA